MLPVKIGPFEIEKPIGAGAMGQVFAARHSATLTPVVLKFLNPEIEARVPWATLDREIRAQAGLDHPNIVIIVDFGRVNDLEALASNGKFSLGQAYIAMEKGELGSLESRLAMPINWIFAKRVLLAILDGLAHAHARGVIHRDIKPANVIGFKNPLRWKLTDFGIAHQHGGSTEQTGLVIGTPQYMAPEQFLGAVHEYAPTTDLYALGCLAYEMVHGTPLYTHESMVLLANAHMHFEIPKLDPRFAVPPEFEEWLHRLLAKDPLDRFRFAADAAYVLSQMPDLDATSISGILTPAPTMHTLAFVETQMTAPPGITETGDFKKREPLASRPPVAPMSGDWRRFSVVGVNPLFGLSSALFQVRRVELSGRESERDRLWNRLARTSRSKRAHLHILKAPFGRGKSVLAQWLVERAHETGAADVLIVNQSLDDAVRRHMQLPPTQPETRIKRICDHFQISTDDWRFAAWTELANGKVSPHATYSYLHQLAEIRPLLLWFDDLEQSPQNINVIDHILQNQDTLPSSMLILACVNSEALGNFTQCEQWIRAIEVHPDTTTTELRDLSAAEVETIIESLLSMDDASKISILTRANTDPSVAIFLVRDWMRRGWLELQKDRVFRLVADISLAEATDASWDERVKDALASLNATERNCILAGAILGQRVDQNEWHALCQMDGLSPHSVLIPSMVDSGLVVWSDDGWVFTHPFVREAILRSAGRHEARKWHALAATLLGARTDLQSISRVATHLTHSAQPEVALTAHAYASDVAFRAGELILAAQHAQTYMQLLQAFPDREAEFLEAHVRYLGILRKRKGACSSDDFETMRTILARARAALYYNVEVDVLVEMSRYLTTIREWSEAERILQLGLAIATRHRLPLYSPVARLADSYAYAGRYQDSYEMYLKALDYVESELDIAWCHFGVGYVLSMQGRHTQAREHLDEAYAIYASLNETLELNSVLNSIADIDRYEKRYDDALAKYHTCLTQMDNTGRVSPALHANITLVAMAKGDIDLGRIHAAKLTRLVTPTLFELQFAMISLLLSVVEEDWQTYDRLFQGMVKGSETGWSEPDMAQGTEIAGFLARDRDENLRAFDALMFAARLWRACNDPGRATVCEFEAERVLIAAKG